MSNNFTVTLSASDKFSVTFNQLQQKAASTAGALRQVNQQQVQVGQQQEKWAKTAGKGLATVSDAAARVAGNLGFGQGPLGTALSSVSALGSGGLFTAGGIFGGVTAAVAGLALLTKNWSEYGTEIARTSSILGVSERGLQTWREAAKLAGGTAEGMTATIAGLGRTLQDALYGRNPQAAMVMSYFGIGTARNAQGGVDVEATLGRVSAVMQRIRDPLTRQTFAAALGLPPEAAYTLGANPAGKYIGMAEKTGVIMDASMVGKARNVDRTLTRTGQRLRSLGYGIGATDLFNLDAEAAAARRRAAEVVEAPEYRLNAERARLGGMTGPAGAASGARPAWMRAHDMGAASAPTVQIDVNIPNAPPGTTVKARSPDNVPIKIGNTSGIAE